MAVTGIDPRNYESFRVNGPVLSYILQVEALIQDIYEGKCSNTTIIIINDA